MEKTLRKILVVLTVATTFQFTASAQNMDNIIVALQKGNPAELARYFQPNIDIRLPEAANSYSKSQAQAVLTAFFEKNTLRSFTVLHQGTSPEGAKYIIGSLATANKTFRVYLYAANSAGSLYIKELRFEEQ